MIEATGATLVQAGTTEFHRAGIDTRTLSEDDLFFAITGKNHDGHDFLNAALKAGATGVVVHRDVEAPEGVSIFRVEDTTKALGKLAAHIRRRQNPKVVSITGSAGKTTTKEIVAHLLSQKYSTLKSQASFNNEYGVPLTLLTLANETHAVVEVGTNHKGEIAPLAKIIAPDIALITNIGYAHIANFGSQEAITREKCELFTHLREGGTAILNGDDPLLLSQKEPLQKRNLRVITTGLSPENDIYATQIKSTHQESSGLICSGEESFPFTLKVPGEHFIQGALLGVAAALSCGLTLQEAANALCSFVLPAGRLNIFTIDTATTLIDDTYNASPDAMLSALGALKLFEAKRIAVLGEMKELGEFSKLCHNEAGKKAAQTATDLIVVGQDAGFIIEGAVRAGFNQARTFHAKDAIEALQKTKELLKPGEAAAILVKGSRFSHMERVAAGLKGLDVKCQKLSCSLYISCEKCELLNVQ